MNEPQNKQNKVTLEDLLHIKRVERPAPAFWANFEQEMRAKQLSALVRKDPWWRISAPQFSRFSRLHLPLGATAVFALAFVTIRQVQKPEHASSQSAALATQAPQVASDELPRTIFPEKKEATQTDLSQPEVVAPVSSLSSDSAPFQTAVAMDDERSVEYYTNHSRPISSELSPSARSIAANLAAAEVSVMRVGQLLERNGGGENLFVSERTSAVEPLTQVTTPRDTRRARLLASAVPADLHSPENSAARSRDRITSHLREESLYDSITRLGLNGNRVSIKF